MEISLIWFSLGSYSTAGTCSYKLCKVKSIVGFIRLDFETIRLVTPTSGTGADRGCATDMLTIKEVRRKTLLKFRTHAKFRELTDLEYSTHQLYAVLVQAKLCT